MKAFYNVRHFRSGLSKVVAAATLLAGAGVAVAAPIAYQHGYDGNALPEDAATDPQWGTFQTTGTSSVSGGILTVTTVNGPPNTNEAWGMGTQANTPIAVQPVYGDGAAGWNAVPATGSTVDFRVKITSDFNKRPLQLLVSDGVKSVSFQFSDNDILGFGTSQTFIDRDNSAYQTFRVAFQNGFASLYVHSQAAPLINNIAAANTFQSRNMMFMGDFSAGDHGTFDLDLLYWSNATAEFSAPPEFPVIPEPATLGLLGLSVLPMLRCRRNRCGCRW